jgi:hypothetical protein
MPKYTQQQSVESPMVYGQKFMIEYFVIFMLFPGRNVIFRHSENVPSEG